MQQCHSQASKQNFSGKHGVQAHTTWRPLLAQGTGCILPLPFSKTQRSCRQNYAGSLGNTVWSTMLCRELPDLASLKHVLRTAVSGMAAFDDWSLAQAIALTRGLSRVTVSPTGR